MGDDSVMAVAGRRRAVTIAGHRGETDTVRRYLEDPAPAVRAAALSALQRCGEVTADVVEAALTDPEPTVRRRAAELAAHCADAELAPALADRDPTVTETAAWAAGERGHADPATVERLAGLARQHPDPLCREAAVAALGALGHPGGLAAVLAATTDKPAIRRRAVLALAPFEGPEVEAAVARAADDRDWQVRQAAEDLGGRRAGDPGG